MLIHLDTLINLKLKHCLTTLYSPAILAAENCSCLRMHAQ